jgi:hypothetical protein
MLADRLPKDSLMFIERFGSRERARAFCLKSAGRPVLLPSVPACSDKNFCVM